MFSLEIFWVRCPDRFKHQEPSFGGGEVLGICIQVHKKHTFSTCVVKINFWHIDPSICLFCAALYWHDKFRYFRFKSVIRSVTPLSVIFGFVHLNLRNKQKKNLQDTFFALITKTSYTMFPFSARNKMRNVNFNNKQTKVLQNFFSTSSKFRTSTLQHSSNWGL